MYDPNTLHDTIGSGYQLHTEAYWRSLFEGLEKHLEKSCRPAIQALNESINQADEARAIIIAEIHKMEGKDKAEELCRNLPNLRNLVRKLLRAYLGGTDNVDTPSTAVDDVGLDAGDPRPEMVSAPETNVPGPGADAPTANANVPCGTAQS